MRWHLEFHVKWLMLYLVLHLVFHRNRAVRSSHNLTVLWVLEVTHPDSDWTPETSITSHGLGPCIRSWTVSHLILATHRYIGRQSHLFMSRSFYFLILVIAVSDRVSLNAIPDWWKVTRRLRNFLCCTHSIFCTFFGVLDCDGLLFARLCLIAHKRQFRPGLLGLIGDYFNCCIGKIWVDSFNFCWLCDVTTFRPRWWNWVHSLLHFHWTRFSYWSVRYWRIGIGIKWDFWSCQVWISQVRYVAWTFFTSFFGSALVFRHNCNLNFYYSNN